MDKVAPDAASAVADIFDGASVAVGGFGLAGVPTTLIAALHGAGTSDLRTALGWVCVGTCKNLCRGS